eukprot:11630008-Karenia_brevis.AAC.1
MASSRRTAPKAAARKHHGDLDSLHSKSASCDAAAAARVEQIFKCLDVDGDGCIEREEMLQVFTDLNAVLWPVAKLDRLFQAADANRD